MRLTKREFMQCGSAMVLSAIFSIDTMRAGDNQGESQTSIASAMDILAKHIDKSFFQKPKVIQLGLFNPKSGDPEDTAYGRRIAEELRIALAAAGFTIDRDATTRVTGDFMVDQNNGEIEIITRLVDKFGEELGERINHASTKVKNATEYLLVSTPTVAIEPQSKLPDIVKATEPGNVENALIAQIPTENNGDTIEFTETKTGKKVSLRLWQVDPNQKQEDLNQFLIKPITPTVLANQEIGYIIPKKMHYAIELSNLRDDIGLAAEVFIDGVSAYHFDENPKTEGQRKVPRYRFWSIQRDRPLLIPGWFKNLTEAYAFQVVPDIESVAYRLGPTHGMGTIQVLLSAAWPESDQEFVAQNFPHYIRSTRTRGTAAGEIINVAMKEEKLVIGELLGSITIRYQ